ncbi:MAG TPA: hypothetical protein PKE54_05125 [Candidatus Obscuribacter sp.]|nr:hypothetical protein [Candidatus Obscuribacter sp.]HND04848.1 hypothetical protein [Candidatus Obscuribacter sp.]
MAIQLNERDQLIFRLIDEHEVLLEKHISWFIAGDEKPVLIRDRLRKLFYLDFLLCQRHGSKLPWWTTPTKPLVYMLSPMARKMHGFGENQEDVLDSDFQRHHLEIANLRMLFLVAQKNGIISDLTWTTFKRERQVETGLNARVTFKHGGETKSLGLVNNPEVSDIAVQHLLKSQLAEKLDWTLVVTREEADQKAVKASLAALGEKVLFSTHQDLYREGIMSSTWQNLDNANINLATGLTLTTPTYMASYTSPPIAV